MSVIAPAHGFVDTIVTADCRDILSLLPDNSFRLAFADPPYWVGFKYGDKKDSDMDYIDPEWLVGELRRLANVVLVMPGIKSMHDYPRPDWILVWYKPAASRSVNIHGGCNWWDPILYYGRGNRSMPRDVVTAPIEFWKPVAHPCPKPERLLRALISDFTEPGDAVLDPVCGSGTTCKVAYEMGRHYLGIEIDPHYAKVASARLKTAQPPLPPVSAIQPELLVEASGC